MATGRQHSASNVDIFLVGTVSLLDVVKPLGQAQKQLAREINPVVMSKGKFLAARKSNEEFVQRVPDEPKILVIGDAPHGMGAD